MAGVGFTRDGAERVAAATRAYEHQIKGGGLPARGKGSTLNPGMRPALAPAGGIAAATGTTTITPGSATCTLLVWGGTTLTSGDSVTVKNKYSVAVGASKRIDIYWWAGEWWVATEQC
jgi:hypothetical protein